VDLKALTRSAQPIFVAAISNLALQLHGQKQERRVERDVRTVVLIPLHEAEHEKEGMESRLALMTAIPLPNGLEPLIEFFCDQQDPHLVIFVMSSGVLIIAVLEVERGIK